MPTAMIDIEAELLRLSQMTIFELRGEWRRRHRAPPPMRLSRDLLVRGITHRLQERSLGGLSPALLLKMDKLYAQAEAKDAKRSAPRISLKPGARLVRQWRGVTHTVLVQTDGFEWSGRRYASLSIIAREITGARWSGPRFFGLPKGAERPDAGVENEHAPA
jgi:hypothetical protein